MVIFTMCDYLPSDSIFVEIKFQEIKLRFLVFKSRKYDVVTERGKGMSRVNIFLFGPRVKMFTTTPPDT